MRQTSALPTGDRRLKQALALSLAAHLLLLLAFREPLLDSDFEASIPELRLSFWQEDGTDSTHESPPAEKIAADHVTAPQAPTDDLTERLVESAETPSAPAAVVPEATIPPTSDMADAAIAAPPMEPAQDPVPARAEAIITTGPSDQVINADEHATVSTPKPVPEATRVEIDRSVAKWTRLAERRDLASFERSWTSKGRKYSAVVVQQPGLTNTDIDRAVVEITAEENGERYRTRVRLKRLAFSHFTQLIDDWDTTVHLHDDVVKGRFHSNSELQVLVDRDAAPRFLGVVSTSSHGFRAREDSGFLRRAEMFAGGLLTGRGRIAMPRGTFAADAAADGAAVHSFHEDTRITFFGDGTFAAEAVRGGITARRQSLAVGPTYLLARSNAALHVRGVVRGSVLVYSPSRIVVDDDLTYAHDPERSAQGTDYVGLVSDRDVVIAPPEVTGDGDLTIHAAIYARGRFEVTRESARNHGTLRVLGSLTAGTISATEPRYATRIDFDARLEERRPPGFPVTDRYEIEGWDQQWVKD